MNYIKLCEDSFIRIYDDFGYITNQTNRKDRIYDLSGKVFLSEISKTPCKTNDILKNICKKFIDVGVDDIKTDFLEFIKDLEKEDYLIIGKSKEELVKKENITNINDNLRDLNIDLLKNKRNRDLQSTSDYLYSYFRLNPTIFGAHFEITSKCNERCVHCYLTNHDIAKDMDTVLALDILDQLKEMGTLSVTFSGGEPFLHKDFDKILIRARENDFIINILTNGTCINNEMIENLSKINIGKIQISLYSMDPEIHDSVTQLKGSHAKTIKCIKALREKKIRIQVSCPILKVNKDSYREVSLWCKNYGVRVLSDFILMAKTNFDTSNLNNRLTIDETEKLISDIIETEEEYRALLKMEESDGEFKKSKDTPVCGLGVDNACITYDGSIYPCSGFQNMVLGNVKFNSIKDIWSNSQKIKELRNINYSSFPKCLDCSESDYCAMCLVRNYNESNGDMYNINEHYCKVAQLTKKLVQKYC